MAKESSSLYPRRKEGDCWPTRVQELLLRAALLDRDEAVPAWRQWKSNVSLDKIDEGSQRLLPLLFYNLHSNNIEDPVINRYKGIYRLTWYDNQIKLHLLSLILNQLHQAGIRTMILKGAALILLHYRDFGLRLMNDLDVLVPREKAGTAANLLTESGWVIKEKPRKALSDAYFNVMHAYNFIRGDNSEFDLHWHLLRECLYPWAEDEFWDGAIPVQLHDVSTNALNPTDQLFHVCVHGAGWNPMPPFRWIADAMMILRSSADEIDWNRMIAIAEKRHLILSIKHTLHYLYTTLDAPIPMNVLRHLQSSRTSKQEEVVYRVKTSRRDLLGAMPLHWYTYLRHTENTGWLAKLKGFLGFLMAVWRKDHLWQIPSYIAVRGGKRIWNVVKGRAGS